MIGEAQRPFCFRIGISCPTPYYYQKKRLDVEGISSEMVRSNIYSYVNKHLPDGSIALIWDHCAAHLIENTYFRITILELPENTTSVNQP